MQRCLRNGSIPGLSLPLVTFVLPLKRAGRQVYNVAAYLLCAGPTWTGTQRACPHPHQPAGGCAKGQCLGVLLAPGATEHALCSADVERRPIPSGHFRISFGAGAGSGRKARIRSPFAVRSLARSQPPPLGRFRSVLELRGDEWCVGS